MSEKQGVSLGVVLFGGGGALIALFVLTIVVVAMRQRAVISAAAAPAVVAPTAVPADSDVAFRAYMAALAPVVMTGVDTTEAIAGCVEDENTAPETAEGAVACLRQKLLAAQAANASLRSIVPPGDVLDRHAAMLTISDEAVRALSGYADAFERAAPTLDRLRHRRPLRQFYSESERREVAALRAQSEGTLTAWGHWLDWISAMNALCNERLRCFGGGTREARGRAPEGFEPRSVFQVNCPAVRTWAAFRGESHEVVLTGRESGLPPFRGGIL